MSSDLTGVGNGPMTGSGGTGGVDLLTNSDALLHMGGGSGATGDFGMRRRTMDGVRATDMGIGAACWGPENLTTPRNAVRALQAPDTKVLPADD